MTTKTEMRFQDRTDTELAQELNLIANELQRLRERVIHMREELLEEGEN